MCWYMIKQMVEVCIWFQVIEDTVAIDDNAVIDLMSAEAETAIESLSEESNMNQNTEVNQQTPQYNSCKYELSIRFFFM